VVYHLLVPLSEYVGSFGVFESITFRALCAGLTAFLICLVVGPGIIARLREMRWRERMAAGTGSDQLDAIYADAEKDGTPTMGGMIFVLATAIAALLFARVDEPLVLASLWTLAAMGVLGGIDDRIKLIGAPDPRNGGRPRKGMYARPKLAGQAFIGLVAVTWVFVAKSHVPGWTDLQPFGLSGPVLPFGLLVVPVGVLVLMGTGNAVNLADGLDGLAAGCATIVILVMAVVAYLVGRVDMAPHLDQIFVPGAGELAVFLCALGGATGGFLWWNAHPAQVFMGNTGSQALGGALAVAAVGMRQEVLLLVAGFAFVWEALSVILQVASYRWFGRRVFRCAPYHHALQLRGWPEPRVVLSFWIGSAACGVVALGVHRVL
jgi:phospho-N-acetylmuramoyl-pentapeptide-transferase